ncbi:MAG: GTP 3',8-cyclase MoaA [Desulfurococcales archaeon]|nr:GTP 3',8-cyclase MoaA [Desulfurococcales archaeon]
MRVHDAYMRPFDNLRIAVTVECNYKCIFCHVEGEPVTGPVKPGRLSPLLKAEDYYVIARAASLLGVSKFKITGGEPLIRGDIVSIVRELKAGAPDGEISMTTNGYLLEKLAGPLAEAGLNRVNISIHSLRSKVYEFITGVNGLERALNGLRAAANQGLRLKVNMVVLKGVNDKEVWNILDLAYRFDAVLQLIELHPVGMGAKFFKNYYAPLNTIEKELVRHGAKVVRRKLHNRPVYVLPSGAKIEIVRPYNNPLFCMGCSRIRVGPFGDLSPCLNWKGPRPSLLPDIREGNLNERILAAARKLVEVNKIRRPYVLPKLTNGAETRAGMTHRIARIKMPKKRYYDIILEELKRQLL